MLFKEYSKKEQKAILADLKATLDPETFEALRKSRWLYNLWIDPDTNSPFLPLEPFYEDTIH